MTMGSSEVASDLPPGAAPSFGDIPIEPTELSPDQLVLSSEEHSQRLGSGPLAYLSGPFSAERFGVGYLSVNSTGESGEMHVHADLSRTDGPAIHLDAHVRATWLTRAMHHGDGSSGTVRVARELFRLAEIPRQSTVTVQIDSPN